MTRRGVLVAVVALFGAGCSCFVPVDEGSLELCDGVDNDHDGLVDLLRDGGQLTRACPLTAGVCAGRLSICTGGTFPPCDYGPEHEAVETRCDGLDNDCDGLVDARGDGGVLTRACPLATGVCAAHVAACSGGAFAACEYGADHEPVETRCDGLDNDCDGLVDTFPDGGALTRACPLTTGVCAGHLSVCSAGAYAACDYGPSYQATERACDGLDNDCDGRIDVSARRLVIPGDAGILLALVAGSPLTYGEIWGARLFQPQGQLLLDTPMRLLTLSSDLGVLRDTQFHTARSHNSDCACIDGDELVRFSAESGTAQGFCLGIQRVAADGGVVSSPAGSQLLAQTCMSGWWTVTSEACAAEGDGWSYLAAVNDGIDRTPFLLRAHLSRDGGLSTAVVDAGPLSDADTVAAADGGWVLFRTFPPVPGPGSWAARCDAQLNCTQVFQSPQLCTPASMDPLAVLCGAERGWWAWSYQTTKQVTLASGVGFAFAGDALRLGSPGPALLGLRAANPGWSPLDVVTVEPQPRVLEHFDASLSPLGVVAHHVQGRLYLLTWGTGGVQHTLPASTTDGLYAEYLCVP